MIYINLCCLYEIFSGCRSRGRPRSACTFSVPPDGTCNCHTPTPLHLSPLILTCFALLISSNPHDTTTPPHLSPPLRSPPGCVLPQETLPSVPKLWRRKLRQRRCCHCCANDGKGWNEIVDGSAGRGEGEA